LRGARLAHRRLAAAGRVARPRARAGIRIGRAGDRAAHAGARGQAARLARAARRGLAARSVDAAPRVAVGAGGALPRAKVEEPGVAEALEVLASEERDLAVPFVVRHRVE